MPRSRVLRLVPQPELPLSPPSWLNAERIALAAMALAGAAAAVPSVALTWLSVTSAFACGGGFGPDSFEHADFGWLVAAPLTLSTLGWCLAFGRRSIGRPASSSVLRGAGYGALNAPGALMLMAACAAVHQAPQPGLVEVVAVVALGGFLGAFPGAILGMLYGLAFRIPLRAVEGAPAHDATDRALVRCGAFLFGVAAPCAFLPLGNVVRATAAVACGIGALGLGLGLGRLALRRRFLARVAAGEQRGWGLVQRPAAAVGAELLPFVSAPRCDGLLVRRIEGDAYRMPHDQALALAPL